MRSRLLLVLCLLLASTTCAAQFVPDAAMVKLRSLSRPGAEPLVASTINPRRRSPYPVFALVFPREDVARIVVLEQDAGEQLRVAARSKEFGYYLTGNYTASMNRFESVRPDRFLFELSFRVGCARGTRTHRFALHDGEWMVVDLNFLYL